MSEPEAPTDEKYAYEHHVVSPRIYLGVFISLLILTALTTAASFVEMYVFNVVVALGIAVIKASLVVLFFMHVKYSPKLTKLTLVSGLFIFMGLISMTLADYMTRAWGRW